jgi:O-antigen/teichoic acid export membrane protein
MAKARSLLFNAGLMGGAQAVGRVLRFFVAGLALSHFGAASWGEVAYALTLSTYVNFVLDFGISSLALIERPDDAKLDRKLFVSLSYARLAVALPLGALALFFLGRMEVQGGLILKLYLLLSLVRPFNLDWWLQRKGYAGVMPSVQMVRQALVLGFLLVVEPARIEYLVCVDVGLECLTAVASWFVGPRRAFAMGPPQREEWRGVWACYRSSSTLFVASSLLLLHQNVDIFFLRYFKGLEAVGVYDYSYRFVQFAFMLGASLSIPLRRQLARLRELGEGERITELVEVSHKVLGVLSAGFLFFALYFSPLLFAWSLPPMGVDSAWRSLVLLSCWLVLSFYSVPLGEWLVTGDRRRYVQLAMIAGVVNVCVNFLLVPRFGIEGAAVAKVCSEAGILIFLLSLVSTEMRRGVWRAGAAHLFLLPGLLAFWYGVRLPWWAVAGAGLALVLVLVRMRYVTRADLQVLRRN